MGYFKSSEELQEILGDFFKELITDATVGPQLNASNIIVKFTYKDPDLSITADFTEDETKLYFNNDELKATVEMSMKADTAHKFWFGKVNLVAALTRREMVAKGPIPKVLKLLPAIKPAYKMYPDYLKSKGREDLLI